MKYWTGFRKYATEKQSEAKMQFSALNIHFIWKRKEGKSPHLGNTILYCLDIFTEHVLFRFVFVSSLNHVTRQCPKVLERHANS